MLKRSLGRSLFAFLLVAVLIGASGWRLRGWMKARDAATALRAIPRVVVNRMDLQATIRTSGIVQSSRQTTIRCEIESMSLSNQVNANPTVRGSSTLLTLVADGTIVKKGDQLCTLDASQYEEQAIQQHILVEQAKATVVQSRLTLEIAEGTFEEFEKGVDIENQRDCESKIVLARSQLDRVSDRLDWSKKMQRKGYLAESQIKLDQQSVESAQIELERALIAQQVYEKFSANRTRKGYEAEIEMARNTLKAQLDNLRKEQDRLDHLELQIKRCTIIAPHDGLVIYANDPQKNLRIEDGMPVRQRQRLFYLPELDSMEILAPFHESVVNLIEEGQSAKVQVEALPHRILEGHVASIDPIPKSELAFFKGNDVKNFSGIVKLDTVPEGLRPGMTAEVEVATGFREQVLAIPVESMRVENGRQICYVAGDQGLERRELRLGLATESYLEVKEGVSEGEEVVLDPSVVNQRPDLLVPHDRARQIRVSGVLPGGRRSVLSLLPI